MDHSSCAFMVATGKSPGRDSNRGTGWGRRSETFRGGQSQAAGRRLEPPTLGQAGRPRPLAVVAPETCPALPLLKSVFVFIKARALGRLSNHMLCVGSACCSGWRFGLITAGQTSKEENSAQKYVNTLQVALVLYVFLHTCG